MLLLDDIAGIWDGVLTRIPGYSGLQPHPCCFLKTAMVLEEYLRLTLMPLAHLTRSGNPGSNWDFSSRKTNQPACKTGF
jgi:hypothetical protein